MKSLCLLLLALAPALIAGQSLVMFGGSFDATAGEIINKIIELAGGPGAKIGIMTMANDNPATDADKQIALFNSFGADATWIPITSTNGGGNDQANLDLVKQQTGIFFSTGTRSRIPRALKPTGVDTPVMTAIRQLLSSGGVVAGNSAGMAVLGSSVCLMSGDTYPVLSGNSGTYDPDGGLGLLEPLYMIDGQFSDSGREGRLIRGLQETRDTPIKGTTRGIGIDPFQALVVTDLYTNPIGKVMGTSAGGVHIYDVKNMISRPSTTVDYENAATSFLSVDDVIDLNTGRITIASWKSLITDAEYYPNAIPSSDILSSSKSNQWLSTVLRLIDNRSDKNVTSLSLETGPQFQVVHDKSFTLSYGGNAPYPGREFMYSYTNIRVSIREA